MHPLVRDVLERSPQLSTKPVEIVLSDKNTGFPIVQHRSKGRSAFKRALRQPSVQVNPVANSQTTQPLSPFTTPQRTVFNDKSSYDDISASADAILANMTQEERAKGQEEIFEHFGDGILDTMEKLKLVRERRKNNSQPSVQVMNPQEAVLPSTETKQPRRKIRFLDPTESDIHVYEPSPSSPRRPLGLLLPPPDDPQEGENITSLKSYQTSSKKHMTSLGDLASSADDSDSPESIRRRFFPSEPRPEDHPSLVWMLSQPTSTDQALLDNLTSNEIRYSLSGVPLSPSEICELPTHMGLHHHASTSSALSSDAPAGYTLEDLLHLSRSSVPAQRVNILGVLGKTFRNTYTAMFSFEETPMRDVYLRVNLNEMRRNIFDSAVEAVVERGWIGQRAVDVLWEIIVGCTCAEMRLTDIESFPRVDLTTSSIPNSNTTLEAKSRSLLLNESSTFLATLPVQRLLLPLKSHLIANSLFNSPTYNAILDIIYILCHFANHAKILVEPNISSGIISTILEGHLSSNLEFDNDNPPNEKPIRILQALALSSRDVAQHLLGPADILLRYVTTMQDKLRLNSIHASMLRETLSFYASLMRYGLYANIVSTAHTHFILLLSNLRKYLLDDVVGATPLLSTYLEILELLIVCATNPHQITPQHDVVWSQIEAFGWIDQVFDLVDTLTRIPMTDGSSKEIELLWTRLFHVLAAWTEGAHVNCVRSGEEEKKKTIMKLRPHVLGGTLNISLRRALEQLSLQKANMDIFKLNSHIHLINAYLRLSLSSMLPDHRLPFDSFSQDLCEISRVVLRNPATFDIFQVIISTNVHQSLSEDLHLNIRSLSALLFLILRIRFLALDSPGAKILWFADALLILHTFLPGDQYFAKWIIQRICETFSWDLMLRILPETIHHPQRGLDILLPFWSGTFIPQVITIDDDEDNTRKPCYPNIWAISEDLSRITSLNLPSLSTLRRQWQAQDSTLIFPLRSTWTLWPLDHLLQSGNSFIFKTLSTNWDATEIEVVRTTLIFTQVVQQLNKQYPSNLTSLSVMAGSETIFTCMKVFMLEDDQGQLETGEVYRDPFVEECLSKLLSPFTLRNANKQTTDFTSGSLELASRSYLGKRIPFYQFYTNFLALYDSISFSHPLFAKLLLPPLSSSYPRDYRKLFFGDYAHVVPTIRTEPADILSSGIEEYLWPIEQDRQILGFFMNVLFKYSVHGFLRWFIIHHLSANIWSDMHPTLEDFNPNYSARLLRAIFSQDKMDTVKNMVLYHQTRANLITPPQCYQPDPKIIEIRKNLLENYDISLKEAFSNLIIQI
ncbi:hypothetical protein Clacol_001741 [Clathrus columnatus]|uniref:RNA polymerase II-associated protein 1 n=1 Tax=Clathrus columnatus TaxID=1419009 RepID=A0AAV5A460_9AGAM|nr:hypothetical protein Clacol_001741 [Clathrus columnatus]